eukprot:3231406-Amphidinium_carterae.1
MKVSLQHTGDLGSVLVHVYGSTFSTTPSKSIVQIHGVQCDVVTVSVTELVCELRQPPKEAVGCITQEVTLNGSSTLFADGLSTGVYEHSDALHHPLWTCDILSPTGLENLTLTVGQISQAYWLDDSCLTIGLQVAHAYDPEYPAPKR